MGQFIFYFKSIVLATMLKIYWKEVKEEASRLVIDRILFLNGCNITVYHPFRRSYTFVNIIIHLRISNRSSLWAYTFSILKQCQEIQWTIWQLSSDFFVYTIQNKIKTQRRHPPKLSNSTGLRRDKFIVLSSLRFTKPSCHLPLW